MKRSSARSTPSGNSKKWSPTKNSSVRGRRIRVDGLVVVKAFRYRHEAELAKSLLESEGIPSVITGGDIGGMYPGFACGEVGVHLHVREPDFDRAELILAE